MTKDVLQMHNNRTLENGSERQNRAGRRAHSLSEWLIMTLIILSPRSCTPCHTHTHILSHTISPENLDWHMEIDLQKYH